MPQKLRSARQAPPRAPLIFGLEISLVVNHRMLASVAAFVALLPFTLAQGNVKLEVESIHAQFQAAYIVPDLLKSFDPTAYLTLVYGGKEVAAGSPLTVQRQF